MLRFESLGLASYTKMDVILLLRMFPDEGEYQLADDDA